MTRLKILSLITLALLVASPAGASGRNPNPYMPKALRATFACIMWHESRSTLAHPNLGDNNANGGSSGVFQIMPGTWNAWAPSVNVHVPVWRATYFQQTKVAVKIAQVDGFGPWSVDGCV